MKKQKSIVILSVIVICTLSLIGIFAARHVFEDKKSSNIAASSQKKKTVVKDVFKSEVKTDKDSSNDDSTKQESNENNNQTTQIVDKPLYDKEVFLTFDDGPSNHTTKVLSILDQYNVKATYFIIGKMAETYPDMLKAINNDGMAVENHSYTHDYNMYKSVAGTESDINKCDEVLHNIIGIGTSKYIRLPGGSDNEVSSKETMANIRRQLLSDGKHYIDWNVSSTDGSPTLVPVQKIVQTVSAQCANKHFAVILMHDANEKTTTVDALPQIIQYLKNKGFTFRTFKDLTPTELNEMIKDGIADRNGK